MKNFIISCFVMLGLLATSFAQTGGGLERPDYKVYTLAGLEVEGAVYSDKYAVMNVSGLVVGETIRIPGADVSDAIKRLWRENIFSDVQIRQDRITGTNIFLTIIVEERPRISSFSFTGVKKGQAEDLREKINFIRGTILTEAKKISAKRVIRNFYVEKGFYGTEVILTSTQDSILKNGVAMKIDVKRGDRIKINDIVVEGNTAFNDKKVIRSLKKIRTKNPFRFWARSKYVPKEFKTAKEGLVTKYNNNGYRDATIEFDTVYSHDNKSINLRMDVYEGDQYKYGDIRFVGNYKYNSEQLKQVLGIQKGDVYNPERLAGKLNGGQEGGDVSSLYMDDGYLFFQVQPNEASVRGDSIDLEIRIQEGPQATVSSVSIEGNTKTSDYVILRMLRVHPGKKFSRSDIIRSQREILNLGFFNQETLNVIPTPNYEDGTVDIKFIVEERPADQLQLQGGWGGRIRDGNGRVIGGGFVGTVQLSFNNFSLKRLFDKPSTWGGPIPSGDGQKLNLAIQMNGVGYQNFSFSFLEPWLGGKKPNSLGVSTSYVVFQNFGSNYRNKIVTTSVDYGRRLKFPDDFFRSTTSLTYKYFDIQNPGSVFRTSFQGEDQAFVNALTLRQSFDRSSVDAPIYPKSGSTMSLSVEFTPPYSLFRSKDVNYADMSPNEKFNLLEYHKWRFNSAWFLKLFGNVVLHSKVEAGFVGSYNRELGISPFERFFLGGAGLVGAFGLDGRDIIPLRGYDDNSINNASQGFPIYTRYIMELRVPLTLNQAAPVWLQGFAEAGGGFTNFRDFDPFKVRRTLGVGMRVMLPMVGLLGLDYAYGFDYNRNATSPIGGRQFHFIIGQQF
ncbi:MAG: outer membrane protein assembly factor BamA, partial [Bacteroidia bacterium]